MKVILLGDTHFGNHKQFGGPIVRGINRRCQEILDAVEREVRKAVEEDPDIEHVIQVGDFFDQARPPAAVIEATIQMMKRFPNLHWHLMKGNHDVASFDAPSALAPLAHIPGISVYEQPTLLEIGGRKYGLIPYIDHSAFTALHMAKLVLSQADILIMHYGVVAEPTRPDQISLDKINQVWDQYRVQMGTRAYPRVFSGHEHGQRLITEYAPAAGLGSFCDLDWSATRFGWPGFAIIDTAHNGVEEQEIDGPAFLGWDTKVSSDESMMSSALNSRGSGIYIEGPAEKESLLRSWTEIELIQGYRIKPVQELPDGDDEQRVERYGFSDLEEPIAEVLDSQGADLADEGTQRVWASCIQHMKEQ